MQQRDVTSESSEETKVKLFPKVEPDDHNANELEEMANKDRCHGR